MLDASALPPAGVFTSLHLLPIYPSSGDGGFAPITYTKVATGLGDWEVVEELAKVSMAHDQWCFLVGDMPSRNHVRITPAHSSCSKEAVYYTAAID